MNGQMMNGGQMVNGQMEMMGPHMNGQMMPMGEMPMNGMGPDMNQMNGGMPNGQMMNGQMMNGQMPNDQMMNGQMNGQMMNGQMNGQMINGGQMMNGQMNGQMMNGQMNSQMNGQMMNGQMNGQMNAQPMVAMVMNNQNNAPNGQGQMMDGNMSGGMPMTQQMMTGQPHVVNMNGQMMMMMPVQQSTMNQILNEAQMQPQQQYNMQMPVNQFEITDGQPQNAESEQPVQMQPAVEFAADDTKEVEARGQPDAAQVAVAKTPELTPERAPEDSLPEAPMLPDSAISWEVTIKNESGTESVVGPVWVACVIVSSLEFKHPETSADLSVEELQTLQDALENEEELGLSVVRAYELHNSRRSKEEDTELKQMQGVANKRLEALQTEASEESQRDKPEKTGDVAQLLTDAQKALGEENGWVTTKSRSLRVAKPLSAQLCPYSRKFVSALHNDPTLLTWLLKVEKQLSSLFGPGQSTSQSATFVGLPSKKRSMLYEVSTHFGFECHVDSDRGTPQAQFKSAVVTSTEFACYPRCLPSKALTLLGSDRATLLEGAFAEKQFPVNGVYFPDASLEEVESLVADVQSSNRYHCTHFGARHVLVEFDQKVAAQQFLRAIRSDSDRAMWFSGEASFGQAQINSRSKHAPLEPAAAAAPAAPAAVKESEETVEDKKRQLVEMGFSMADASIALTKHATVEAAAQALLEQEEQERAGSIATEEPKVALAPTPKSEKKNDKADWMRASRGTTKQKPKSVRK
jgi:hypothetical protein